MAAVEAEQDLLDWARDIANREVVLRSPVRFCQSRLVPLTVTAVGHYAARFLTTIAMRRSGPRFGFYTDEWYDDRARDAVAALIALRAAMET